MRPRLVPLVPTLVLLLCAARAEATPAPTPPSSLTATATSTSTITLGWVDTTRWESGYLLERSLSATTGFTQIATTSAGVTSFRDSGLASATRYFYRVRATGRGGTSAYSNVANATTLGDAIAPAAPATLSVTDVGCTQIGLAWAASTDAGGSGLRGYKVYRNGAYVRQVLAPATTTSDSGLAASTPYVYTVSAIDNAGNESTPTAPVGTATTTCPDTAAPSVPTGLTAASSASCSRLDLAWTASIDTGGSGLRSYKVYRNGLFVFEVLAPSTIAADTGLAGATTYAYAIAAVDNAGNESAQSLTSSATTAACVVSTTSTSSTTSSTSSTTSTTQPSTTSSTSSTSTSSSSSSTSSTSTSTAPSTTSTSSTTSSSTSSTQPPTTTSTSSSTSTTQATSTSSTTSSTSSTLPSPTTSTSSSTSTTRLPTTTSTSSSTSSSSSSSTSSSSSSSSSTSSSSSSSSSTSSSSTSSTLPPSTTSTTSSTSTLPPTTSTSSSTSTTRPSTTTSSSTSTTSSSTTSSTRPNQAPIANAGPDQFTQTQTAIAFSGAGSSDADGTVMAWSWSFGDGAAASGVSASHAYAKAGTYTVTLTVTDDRGATASDTAIASVANRPPVANAGPDQSATVGASVSFSGAGSSDPDGTITGWSWSFGDGASASGATGSHAYAAAGSYTVTLTVTDDAGAVASDTAVVTVLAGGGGAVAWVDHAGNTGFDEARGLAVDRDGNVLMTGQVAAPIDLGGVTCSDSIVVAKYTAGGTLVWARCLGGLGGGSGLSVAADPTDGSLAVTGYFRGTVDFGGGPLSSPEGYDVFLVKYAADGTHRWSQRFGSPTVNALPDEYGTSVAIDGAGNVLLTGVFEGTADFGGGPLTSVGQGDVFLAKYDRTGAPLWSKRFGGAWNDTGNAVAVDAAGNVFVTGTFLDPVDFGGGPLVSTGFDAFLAKYSPSGAHIWSKRFGGTLQDAGTALAVDASGSVILAGSFNNTIDLGGGPFTSAGGNDVFLAKLTDAGAHVWSRRIGGTSNYDAGNGLAVDASGNVFLAGFFSRTVDFGLGAITSAGSKDAYLAEYAPSGTPLMVKRWGGINIDTATSVAVDRAGDAVVAGSFFASVDFGTGMMTSAGDADLYLVCVTP